MTAISASTTIGHEMSASRGRQAGTTPESGMFVVRCSFAGVRVMARADPEMGVKIRPDTTTGVTAKKEVGRLNLVNEKQYDALVKSGIAHEVVSAPPSYKPPVVRIQRK